MNTQLSDKIFHVIHPNQFDRQYLEDLSTLADKVRFIAKSKQGSIQLRALLANKRAMLYFTQPSTRTFVSFSTACQILGIQVTEVRDASTSSEIKGESFEDTIRTFSSYTDIIIMRTWEPGYASRAAQLMDSIPRRIPIINGGSGPDLHPTQGLLDIYTLLKSFTERGGIDGKTIGFVGDLKRGRTVRTLCYLLANFSAVKLRLISPTELVLSDDIKQYLATSSIDYSEHHDLSPVLSDLDALYLTRTQSEYGEIPSLDKLTLDRFRLDDSKLPLLKSDAVIMHPLPRGPELVITVDTDPRAIYWRQERNGMWIRVALLAKIFGVSDAICNL